MRVAVMGPGGLGGRYGVILARGGEDVSLIARGAHLQAIRERGLTLRDGDSDVTVRIRATDDPGEIGPVDLVLFCVKTYDLVSAAEQTRPLVGDETMVLTVLNGVESVDLLGDILGKEHIIAGATYASGIKVAPGIVAYGGVRGNLIFGEPEGGESERTQRLLETFEKVGLPAELRTDMPQVQWEKFVAICASGGVLTMLRLPMGPTFECPESSALFLGVMKEIEALGRARGVVLPEGYAVSLYEYYKANADPSTRSSTLMDLTAGRRLELDALTGTAVRLGRTLGVPTPLNEVIYAALKPYENGPPVLPGA